MVEEQESISSAEPEIFGADRPIKGRAQDRLGRAGFAQAIGRAINGWRGDDSLVIALYGPWGSGKSSIKNMVREALGEFPESHRPRSFEFNPWEFSGTNQLSDFFFREVGRELGRVDKSKESQRLEALFKGLGAALETTGGALEKVPAWLPALTSILSPLGLAGSVAFFLSGKSILGTTLLVFVAAMGPALKGLAGGLLRIADKLKGRTIAAERSIPELKAELAGLLSKRSRPLVVFIDDVDRLSAPDIQLLFRLVRVNADLPRLVYVMLFQRDVIERALGGEGRFSGREYLAKLVQAGYDVPSLNRDQLQRVLFEGLSELVDMPAVRKNFDRDHWSIMFPAVDPYFGSLRDVHRFLSTFRLQVGLLRQGDSLEVNPVDLIALEALRVFEPEVYHRLPIWKTLLTGTDTTLRVGRRERQEKSVKDAFDRILDGTVSEGRTRAMEVLKELFPTVAWVFGATQWGDSFSEKSAREMRVCSSVHFDRYFQLAVPAGDLSRVDLERVLALAGDRDSLVQQLRSINERGLLATLMNRLEAFKETIDLAHAVPFITALFDIGDELSSEQPGFFGIQPDMHAARIVYWYLRREPELARREGAVEEAIRNTSGLFLPAYTIALESDRSEKNRGEDLRLIGDEKVLPMRRLCAEKIARAAGAGTLRGNSHLSALLFHWKDWGGDSSAPTEWVKDLIKSKEGVLELLVAFLQTGHSTSGRISRAHHSIHLPALEHFVRVEEIQHALAGVVLDDRSDTERLAAEKFYYALKRRREGKREDVPPFVAQDD